MVDRSYEEVIGFISLKVAAEVPACDVEAVAVVMVGALLGYSVEYDVFGRQPAGVSEDRFIDAVVDAAMALAEAPPTRRKGPDEMKIERRDGDPHRPHYLAVTIGLVAAMILISPRGFYDDFPGPRPGSRLRPTTSTCCATSAGLGLAVLARLAAAWMDRRLVQAAAISLFVGSCLHGLPRHHLRELLHRRQHRQLRPRAPEPAAAGDPLPRHRLRQEPGAARRQRKRRPRRREMSRMDPPKLYDRLTWRIAKRKAGGDRVPEPVAVSPTTRPCSAVTTSSSSRSGAATRSRSG